MPGPVGVEGARSAEAVCSPDAGVECSKSLSVRGVLPKLSSAKKTAAEQRVKVKRTRKVNSPDWVSGFFFINVAIFSKFSVLELRIVNGGGGGCLTTGKNGSVSIVPVAASGGSLGRGDCRSVQP